MQIKTILLPLPALQQRSQPGSIAWPTTTGTQIPPAVELPTTGPTRSIWHTPPVLPTLHPYQNYLSHDDSTNTSTEDDSRSVAGGFSTGRDGIGVRNAHDSDAPGETIPVNSELLTVPESSSPPRMSSTFDDGFITVSSSATTGTTATTTTTTTGTTTSSTGMIMINATMSPFTTPDTDGIQDCITNGEFSSVCVTLVRAIDTARQYDWWCQSLCNTLKTDYPSDLYACNLLNVCTTSECIARLWSGICQLNG